MGLLKLILAIFFTLFVVGLLVLYWFVPTESIEFWTRGPINNNFTLNNSALEDMQFYSKMRFPEPAISYRIDDRLCTLQKQDEMERAFDILENLTVLTFYPVNSDEQISVTCNRKIKREGELFIAGEGGPTNITKTQNFNVIFRGQILLLRDSKCSTPNIALHELLHVLGFDHSENPKNIMYEITSCEQTIGQDIPSLINELYSVETKTDLGFENVSAFMRGRYLDLNMSIRNNGLKNSEEFNVAIYTDNKEIKEIDFEPLEIGHGIAILLTNILVWDINVNEIELSINYPFEELEKNNNRIKLEVKK